MKKQALERKERADELLLEIHKVWCAMYIVQRTVTGYTQGLVYYVPLKGWKDK